MSFRTYPEVRTTVYRYTMKKVVLFISLHLFLLLNQIFDTGFLHTTHRAKPCTPKMTKNCSTLLLQMLRSIRVKQTPTTFRSQTVTMSLHISRCTNLLHFEKWVIQYFKGTVPTLERSSEQDHLVTTVTAVEISSR